MGALAIIHFFTCGGEKEQKKVLHDGVKNETGIDYTAKKTEDP